MRLFIAYFLAASAAWPLHAAPRIVVDLPVTASLVAKVAGPSAEIVTLLSAGVSPHGMTLKPSDARAIAAADAVIWMGPGLTPALEGRIEALNSEGATLALMEVEGTLIREAAGHDGHGHEKHDDSHQGGGDPHGWLDPANARRWLPAIAATLSEIDPEAAGAYAERAESGAGALERLEDEVAAILPRGARVGVLAHDALRHFEDRFGVTATGVIADSEDAAPGARRIALLREALIGDRPGCVLYEGEVAPPLAASLADEIGARLVEIDLTGVTQPPGADLYEDVMLSLARTLASCRDDEGAR